MGGVLGKARCRLIWTALTHKFDAHPLGNPTHNSCQIGRNSDRDSATTTLGTILPVELIESTLVSKVEARFWWAQRPFGFLDPRLPTCEVAMPMPEGHFRQCCMVHRRKHVLPVWHNSARPPRSALGVRKRESAKRKL